MPRFLNTSTGEFEWHKDPAVIAYAILSHTWRSDEEGGEQSYDDVRALQAEVANGLREQTSAHEGSPPSCILSHPSVSDKIKGVCKVAREAGIRLVWNDACCIDKSSSAELSEAINSMYELYRLSQVCYVYLEDVPDGDEPRDQFSDFRWSRWHRRGWTLQELIAPEAVEFLTKTWRLLGTKMGLATTLEQITGVDFKILTGQATVYSASVARRMSWASRRETTRIEDRAYSLMGIFGIHMSPIYGEGDNAFLRLQEEIVRTIPDQSIFAWGSSCVSVQVSQHDVHVQIHPKHSSDSIYLQNTDINPSLLASGLSAFQGGAHITPITPSALASRLRLKEVPSLHCVFTPHGVRVQLLSLNLASLSVYWEYLRRWNSCSDCLRMKADTLALLQCEDESGSLIALPLRQPRDEADGNERGILIGTHIQCNESRHEIQPFSQQHHPYHTVRLTKVALAEILEHVTPAIINVTVLRHQSKPASTKLAIGSYSTFEGIELFSAGDQKEPLAFRIPPRDIEALRILGFVEETPLQVQSEETADRKSFIVNTSFAVKGGNVPSPTKECPQTIQLTLTLNVIFHTEHGAMIDQYPLGRAITVRFCIVNNIGVPAGNCPCQTFPPTIPSPEEVNDPSYVMTRAPCVDGNKDFSPEIGIHTSSFGDRVIADAEFTIYVDPDWEEETCAVRFLRVSLAFQTALEYVGTESEDDPNHLLYLSIQLSEKYRHTRRSIADRTLPGDLPPSQTAGDICQPATPNQPSSANCTNKDAEVLEVTDPTVSVVTSKQSEDSVALSSALSQPLLSALNQPAAPEVGGLSQCTPLYQHDQRNVHPIDSNRPAKASTGTAVRLASNPCDVRSKALSNIPNVQPEPSRPSVSILALPSPPIQPEGAREPVSEECATDHSGCECYDVFRRENSALRAQMSVMNSQISDLISKNEEMSLRMTAISSRTAATTSRIAPTSPRITPTGASTRIAPIGTARTSPALPSRVAADVPPSQMAAMLARLDRLEALFASQADASVGSFSSGRYTSAGQECSAMDVDVL